MTFCISKIKILVAGLGDARNQHDPNMTYEGENHVLIQQTSNWLLKYWPLILKGQQFSTPLNSIGFLNDAQEILKNRRFSANNFNEIISPDGKLHTIAIILIINVNFFFKKYFLRINGLLVIYLKNHTKKRNQL